MGVWLSKMVLVFCKLKYILLLLIIKGEKKQLGKILQMRYDSDENLEKIADQIVYGGGVNK